MGCLSPETLRGRQTALGRGIQRPCGKAQVFLAAVTTAKQLCLNEQPRHEAGAVDSAAVV
jgi:hypothetical protein